MGDIEGERTVLPVALELAQVRSDIGGTGEWEVGDIVGIPGSARSSMKVK